MQSFFKKSKQLNKPKMTIKIEITIPVLNEASSLDKQIQKLHAFIKKNLLDIGLISIIIADNGSTDETEKIAKRIEKKLDNIKYIKLDKPGVGRALKASWGGSSADIIGYMDLDLATDLQYLRPALESVISEKYQIVTGSRLLKTSKVFRRAAIRTFVSICLNSLIKLIFRSSVSDVMCGFKFIRRNFFLNLLKNGAKSDGWFFAAEILIVAEYLGYKIRDLPVRWSDSDDSKVKIFTLSFEYIKAILMLKKRFTQLRK